MILPAALIRALGVTILESKATMKSIANPLLLIILLLSSAAYSQPKFDVCRVNTSWWSTSMGRGSGNMRLGEFRTTVEDEPTVKVFHDSGSGLTVSVGVKYDYYAAYGNKPYAIRLALAVAKTEEDAFEFLDNAIAGANYGRNWGSLFVEKKVAVGQLEHTFTLVCEDGNRKRKLNGGR